MSTTSPLLKTRTLLPSCSTRKPTRSPFFDFGLNTSTFEISSGIALSLMPPISPIFGFGLMCFFAIFTPSTSTRSSANTSRTVPRRPLSLPVFTMTSSPFLILFIACLKILLRSRFENRSYSQLSYKTSGAREIIFMNRFVRSSRVTGPKIRVPMGSRRAFNRTAALPSKRISEPSLRRTPLRVHLESLLRNAFELWTGLYSFEYLSVRSRLHTFLLNSKVLNFIILGRICINSSPGPYWKPSRSIGGHLSPFWISFDLFWTSTILEIRLGKSRSLRDFNFHEIAPTRFSPALPLGSHLYLIPKQSDLPLD